jgi:hypothetical protein
MTAEQSKYIDFARKFVTELTVDKLKLTEFNSTIRPGDFESNGARKIYVNPDDLVVGNNFNNIYTMPSINASYLGALGRYTYERPDDLKTFKQDAARCNYRFDDSESGINNKYTKYCAPLLESTAVRFIKYLDTETTYLYCVYLLAKQVSYYRVDHQRDESYFPSPDMSPFAVQI